MNGINISLVVTAAFLDSFNPCAFGVMLMFIALVFSLHKKQNLIWLFGVSYILGIFITYLFIGVGILKAVHLFGIHGFFGYVASTLLIIFGLFHLNIKAIQKWSVVRFINSCHVPKDWQRRVASGTILAAVTLGVLVGICEFPCSGGIYLGTVGLLANSATFWQGIGWLLMYNVIFVLPLVVILLFAGNKVVLNKISQWQKKYGQYANTVMGVTMILLGLLLLSWLIV